MHADLTYLLMLPSAAVFVSFCSINTMLSLVFLIILAVIGLGDTSKCRGSHYTCVDCNRVRVCKRTKTNYKELMQISCSDPTPYCSDESGSCSYLPSWRCAPKSEYPCMQNGMFPDPSNCKAYRKCRHGVQKNFNCSPSGNHFDAALGRCRQGATCDKIDCKNKHGKKVPHPKNAQYYAYCDNEKPAFVDKCPGVFELDAELQVCVPKCQKEGDKILDHTDLSYFYLCSKSTKTTNLEASRKSCLLGFQFEPVQAECVRRLDQKSDLVAPFDNYYDNMKPIKSNK